jgi:hypothetical protein
MEIERRKCMADPQKSDLDEGIGELSERVARAEQVFRDGCLSNEVLLEIMRGNSEVLGEPAIQRHLAHCAKCKDLVSYAQKTQASYERDKQRFLSTIQEKKTTTPRIRWLRQAFYPIRAAFRPSRALAVVAIVALVLALLPLLFGPQQEDPKMVNALKRIAGQPVEDVGSAQKMATQMKNDSVKGIRTEPNAIEELKKTVEDKLDTVGNNEKLKGEWTSVQKDLNTANFFNQYQALTIASGSVDSLQSLGVTEARMEDHDMVVDMSHEPRDKEFASVVREANQRAGLEQAGVEQVRFNIPNSNGFVVKLK